MVPFAKGAVVNILKVTDHEINVLRAEAGRAGDLRMEAICVLATEGRDGLKWADHGSECNLLLQKRSHTQSWARQQCAAAIAAARAQEEV